jgi:GT2 family glycosyltransferase
VSAGARVVPVELRQIAAVRNAGARAARGDVLVFLDADSALPARTFARTLAALRNGAVGGGAVIRFDRPVRFSARLLIGMWHLTQRVTGWAAGAYVFARRDAFEAAGGFDERYFAGEELVLSRALKRQGRFVILRAPVLTSSRKAHTHRPGEILWLMLTLAVRGPKALQRREGLDLWYKRREE